MILVTKHQSSIPLTPAILPENSPGGFEANGGVLTPGGYDNGWW